MLLEGVPADLLDLMVAGGIRSARNYGLVEPSDVAGFVYLMFEIGPEFHKHPEANALLSDRSLGGREKLNRLLTDISAATWNAIALDRQNWFPETE